MSREEFVNWIESLGFSRTWESNPDEYSIYPEDGLPTSTWTPPKLYFHIDFDEIRIYYSKFSSSMSYGSNLGRFPLSSIGDFEKLLIVTKLSEYFDELPQGFKVFLRDSKIKNILGD
jgi:hypothetical protein